MNLWIRLSFILILSGLLLGCATKKAVVPSPPTPIDEAAFQEHVARGDRFFAQSHLYAWRRAEAEYESALEVRADAELLEKLRLIRYLILDREIDEEIYASNHEKRLDSICFEAMTPFQTMLCRLARAKLSSAGLMESPHPAEAVPFCSDSALLKENFPLLTYLSLRCSLTAPEAAGVEGGPWASSYIEGVLSALATPSKRKPLMLYVQIQERLLDERDLFSDRFPQFAELFCARGRSLLAGERYREGIAALERTLELIPDHTGAFLQLGNLYLFTLQYYSRALEYFNKVLKWDPNSVEGLFGKGVALHGLGRYRESQVALQELLDAPDTRWSTVPVKDRIYYRSNGDYYRAYNAYEMGSRTDARKWVDLALRLDRTFDGSHYLSGLLRFDEGDVASAQAEFQRVTQGGTMICDAYFKLGMIAAENDPLTMGPYFLNNGICLERGIAAERQRIGKLRTADLDPESKQQLIDSARKRVIRLKSDALASTMGMLNTVRRIQNSEDSQLIRSLDILFDRLNTISVE